MCKLYLAVLIRSAFFRLHFPHNIRDRSVLQKEGNPAGVHGGDMRKQVPGVYACSGGHAGTHPALASSRSAGLQHFLRSDLVVRQGSIRHQQRGTTSRGSKRISA